MCSTYIQITLQYMHALLYGAHVHAQTWSLVGALLSLHCHRPTVVKKPRAHVAITAICIQAQRMRETSHQFSFPLFCLPWYCFRLFPFVHEPFFLLSTTRYFLSELHVGSTLDGRPSQSRIFISGSLLRHPNSKLSLPDPSSTC
jgi:hypothetical protein